MKLLILLFSSLVIVHGADYLDPKPFGESKVPLDTLATGEWWEAHSDGRNVNRLLVPRDEVLAFSLYLQDRGVLKMTAQLYPLKPEEEKQVRLELKLDGEWQEVAREKVQYPGWSAHFRVEDWDDTQEVAYRLLHGESAGWEGVIRKNPREQEELVMANMSCNASNTSGPRAQIVSNLLAQDPDLLYFAGDQTYNHEQATMGWLEFGMQFRELMRDRPTITIPDDHDIGQPNLWGENGKVSTLAGNSDGGYIYPPSYVNMVQRLQTWHLPDAFDPTPVERGIGVYYTNFRIAGIDFAILEDRKFKSGPHGKIPSMGPRPDHINNPDYDPKSIDVDGLELLGSRQEKFLATWSQDWTDTEMKAVLSATAFCGGVHIHGRPTNRLLADLDCNGWPQTPRNNALRLIRQAKAVHLCGDQHLAVAVKHGIDSFGDGPYAFTSPALVNTIYGRWWHPHDELAGPNPVPNSPLPWTGDFHDGLGNKISMLAYANPKKRSDERQRGDGYGIVRFNKRDRSFTFECYKRFAKFDAPDAQYAGWPMTHKMADNDGRQVRGYLPTLTYTDGQAPVVQVVDESSGEILYTERADGDSYQPKVYGAGPYSIKVGKGRVSQVLLKGAEPAKRGEAGEIKVEL